MRATLTCPACKGTGTSRLRQDRPCCTCRGEKKVHIDTDAILAAIRSTQGPNRGRIRVARTDKMDAVFGATYVWRMARFHGGVDTSMPVMCAYTIGCGGLTDQYVEAVEKPLGELAQQVARDEYGTDIGAANVWGSILGAAR